MITFFAIAAILLLIIGILGFCFGQHWTPIVIVLASLCFFICGISALDQNDRKFREQSRAVERACAPLVILKQTVVDEGVYFYCAGDSKPRFLRSER